MIRSIYLILFTFFFTVSSKAQEVQRTKMDLQWTVKTINADPQNDKFINVHTFENAQLDGYNIDISKFIYKFELDSDARIEVELVNVISESISNDFYTSNIDTDYKVSTFVDQIRNDYLGGISIIPVKKTGDAIERILSCDIIININHNFSYTKRGPVRTFESVLSSGEIFKIAVSKSGVYKLNNDQLKTLGINTERLNPKKIKLYSNYGGSLPEKIADQNPDDLIEIPIIVNGEADGSFNQNDEVIFYLEGPDKWIASGESYTYQKNIYDTKNYAYIKIDGADGKRMKNAETNITAEIIASDFDHLQTYQEDLVNLLALNSSTEGSGKLWFGKRLGPNEELDLSQKFDLNDLAKTDIEIKLRFASRSGSSSSTQLKVNNKEFNSNYNSVNLFSIDRDYADLKSFTYNAEILNPNTPITLKYSASAGGDGYIDFVDVISRKSFRSISGQTLVQDKNDKNYSTFGYNLSSLPNGTKILDVTNLDDVVIFNTTLGTIQYNTDSINHRLFAYAENSILKPELIGSIPNQNLHQIEDVDMVVLYPEVFKEGADKFIAHRSSHSGLTLLGINVQDIYQEFSSGRQDPSAIRDFAKMIADRNDNFRYMLFIGDGSYDQRQINTNIPDHRFIPVYETDESLNPIRAFPTDDYFALLSDNEGVGLDGGIDLAIGRLTVTTPEELDAVLNKIVQYDISPNRFGDWRLRSTFTADDEDTNTHLNQMDGIARMVSKDFDVINDQKIYFDAYRQETTPGGQRYPDVESAFDRAMDRGHLTFCYLGHGGPKGWAQERVLKIADIQEWDNINSQTIIISATCSFTGYDDPEIKSAGEFALLNPKGGAVALFTTVRAVYASDNERLTREVFKNVYLKDNEGLPMTFGDAITIAKNTNKQDTVGENSRKFSLIGDPSQRIALPSHDISIEKINDIELSSFTDTIGALEEVTISGFIKRANGDIMNDFNGKIYPTIFDKRTSIETLKNDAASIKTKIDVMKNIIFKGIASVESGAYSFSFIVPKDINYAIGKGKISLYATDNITDAAGSYSEILIGGSGNAIPDENGPIVDVFMNDESFIAGGIVSANSSLLVKLSDDLGINVTGTSIGHDLTAELTGPINEKYILNEFYEAELDDYKKGVVRFPFNDLEPGKYTISVKAWDVSNNSATGSTEFIVKEGGSKLFNVSNYPNPFSEQTTFSFNHNLGPTNALVELNIFDVTGQLITSYSKSKYLSGGNEIVDDWDNYGAFANKATQGVYLYKIKVTDTSLGIRQESNFQKLVKF